MEMISHFKILCITVISICSLKVYSIVPDMKGARSWAMGGISLVNNNATSVFGNASCLAYNDNLKTTFVHKQGFLLKELSQSGIAVSLPFHNVTLGGGVSYFGYSLYNEMASTLAIAKKLSSTIAAGIRFCYYRQFASPSFYKNHYTFGVGLIIHPINTIEIGVNVFNPFFEKENNQLSEISSEFSIGLNYHVLKNVILSTEYEKNVGNPPCVKAGWEWFLTHWFVLRSGVASNPALYTFGTGFVFQKYTLNLAFQKHAYLGFTPVIDFTLSF